MTFSLRNFGLIFPDYGAKPGCPVFTLAAVLGDMIDNIANPYIPGIASAFEKAISVERFLYLVSVRLYDVGELPLGLIVITENTVEIFLMSVASMRLAHSLSLRLS